MRFIDADKLIKKMTSACQFVLDTTHYDSIYGIPIVEAIPVEWLKKYIDKLNSELSHDEIDDPSDVWAVVTLETLLEDWEEHDGKDG